MKFASFLSKNHLKGNECIELAYQISKGNYDYPSHLSSKGSVFNWLNRKNYDPKIINAFSLAWNEFEKTPYCTISKTGKTRITKRIDT